MAHNLNYNSRTGKYSFATTKPAWHQLGQVVDKAMTAEEAIKLANLDYTVTKEPHHVILEDGTTILNSKSFSTVRRDTNQILGTVGSDYTVIQNTTAFEFFTEFAGEKAAMFETAGTIGQGELIFISCKLPDVMVVGKKDAIDEYLLLINSHDGSKKITAMFTPIRVVCNNTLNQAISNYRMKIELKHTTNVDERVKEAHKLLGIHRISMNNRSEIFNLLNNTPVTDKLYKNFLYPIFLTHEELQLVAQNNNRYESIDEISTRKKNIINATEAYLFDGVGQREIEGTAWWVLNGLTGYYQNVRTYTTIDDKFKSIVSGDALSNTSALMKNLVEFCS